MKWNDQFVIIKQIIAEKLQRKGKSYSQVQAQRLLGLKPGRIQAWEKGQKPNADDLATMTKLLHLSPRWTLLGEGEPRGEQSAKGHIVGDLLHDLLLAKYPSLEAAAEALDIQFGELDACIGLAPAPSWKMLQKLALGGVNVNFLLLGEGEEFSSADSPPSGMGPIAAAVDKLEQAHMGLDPDAKEEDILDVVVHALVKRHERIHGSKYGKHFREVPMVREPDAKYAPTATAQEEKIKEQQGGEYRKD